MICSKCNSEIPNGAKFCTVCGAECETAPAASAQKCFCPKCGLEHNSGAKFCTSCGAAITSAAPQNNGSNAAVSLNKEPTANDLVATMNAAAASVPASAAVPTPAATVPTPAATVPTPAPTTSTAGFNNGFSAPTTGTAPAAPQTPSFAPSGSSAMPPMDGTFNGLSGAAAVVAAPAKKKGGAGKIVLIIAIVLVALFGGAAAFFFSNKATALSLVMGKPKYAAMIEKESLKKVTDSLDLDTVSEQIKSVSSTVSTIVSANSIMIDDPIYELANKIESDPELAKLMAVSPSLYDGFDVKAILKGYSDAMQSSYGASRISGSMSAKITLGRELANYSDEEIDKVLDLINSAGFTYDFASTEKMIGGEFGVKFNNKTIDARVIVEDDGSAYVLFPFATDKALKYKIATVDSASTAADDTPVLDLDSAEIERLINEIVDIYSNYIKESSVTMEKGSMSVADVTIEGKQITADINGKNLENLFKDVFEHIANDQYFCGKIVEYIKNFDPDFTESDYKNSITDLVKDMSGVTEEDKLIVTTIVNNSGKVLAKSYTISDKGNQIGTVAFADNNNVNVFDIKANNQSIFTVRNVKSGEKDGRIVVAVSDGKDVVRINIDYSGVGTADFGKTQIPVGTYTLSIDTSGLNIESIYDREEMEILDSLALTFGTTVSGNTANYKLAVSVRDYIDLELNADMTLSDDVSKYSAPSNVIDLTPIINGEDLNDATKQQLSDYIEELAGGLYNAFEGTGLEDIFSELMESSNAGTSAPSGTEPVAPTPKPDTTTASTNNKYYDNVDDLEDRVFDEMMEIYDLFSEHYSDILDSDDEDAYLEILDDPAFILADEYMTKLEDLDDRLWDAVLDGCTDEQLKAFNNEFAEIIKQKDAVKKALTATPNNNNNNNSTTSSNSSSSSSKPNESAGSMTASRTTTAA